MEHWPPNVSILNFALLASYLDAIKINRYLLSRLSSVFISFFISVGILFHSPANADVIIGRFSSGDTEEWQAESFKGRTLYQIISLEGEKVLQAESNAAASGLYREKRIDLLKTPFLNWRWRIVNRLRPGNEKEKSGDDYAARVYVVISGGWAFWRTRAINYVWSASSAKFEVWPNAFAGKHAMMIALRSKDDPINRWHQEKRNVFEDLKNIYGEEIRYIDAVALMTDTDNSGAKATAYYGDIYFSEN